MVHKMKYLSVCSGIEAASVAWTPLGFTPVGFSEIEKFPSEVLKHHYPETTNYGDINEFRTWKLPAKPEIIVGGTPCQAFSIAGKRGGLDDPRGQIMLRYLELIEHHRPRWIVWENVPGVLSSNKGRDFGTLLTSLGNLGYGWAYRILDSQWIRTQQHPGAVPQRRRRVFVVGCLGDVQRPAKVLFESQSLCRNSTPVRTQRETIAGGTKRSPKEWPANVASTLEAAFASKQGLEDQHINGGAKLFVLDHFCEQTLVRRLTPKECERLQGFPDDYTRIPWNGKSADKCPDGPRYKALGNSMATNCMEWIGRKITEIDTRP